MSKMDLPLLEEEETESTITLTTLIPNPKNPRSITDEALLRLQESIKRDPEFMSLRPIVIDENNVIIGGNMRYQACLANGMQAIPEAWVRRALNLTDEQRKRFVIVDNAPEGMSGTWDFSLLREEFNSMETLPESLGFTALPAALASEAEPPEDFQEIDENIKTDTACPKCGYTWSGGK